MRYSYQVPAALLTELRRLADRVGKSLSALIRSILTEHIQRNLDLELDQATQEVTCYRCNNSIMAGTPVFENDEVYPGFVVFFCSAACVREFDEERHASGCICADCSDAKLTAEND